MNSWATFWEIVLVVVFGLFTLLVIAVSIGGFFDLKAMFKIVSDQHAAEHEKTEKKNEKV